MDFHFMTRTIVGFVPAARRMQNSVFREIYRMDRSVARQLSIRNPFA